MSLRISELRAVEILDSRARPTLDITLTTDTGTRLRAGVPSGASTGTREAVELHDGDPARFAGQGVLQAVDHVNGEIAQALVGRDFASAADVDAALIALDGTETKSRLGANAIVGVSLAAARADAVASGKELWQYLADTAGRTPRLPVPHFNVVNGGAHAANNLDFQEFMLAPLGAPSLPEAVRAGAEVYARLKARLAAGGHPTGLGDEGGFAPDIDRPEDVLALLVQAITDAGYTPGREGIALALDPAASEFFADGRYRVAGENLRAEQLVDRYEEMIERFPVWSIEDGLAEDDWEGWVRLTERLGDRVQLMGDDIFVTNPAIITRAVARKVGNSALIKVNQIGTVTETLEAMSVCDRAGYTQMISHRSGETPDTFIADLAVGTGCGQIKSGAPARGERVAKYNRFLELAADHGDLPFGLDSTA
ncbi:MULTISPECIES: phosphopyruvate hydratase [unclassified Streptomyces]|uniref:phosphopyruvate hydratase n=1 Tax=unclassified Streptomyces TaxID=2593676 RepID=UPI00039A1A51|nr:MULTISPECIES: phosphopyruvate hydratase [unclassified Streptomyces]MYQ75818.1 phosphopyruvate hydratase [Streptomyces sp. SID4923]